MLSFEQFLNKVDNTYGDNPFVLRYGQTVMNTLYEVWPEKYKQITQTDLDCFYNDGIVEKTLNHLKQHWH